MIIIIEPLIYVYKLSLFTVFLGILLDTTVSSNTMLEILKKNPQLYLRGLNANYLNLLIISPIYYIFAYNYLLNYNNQIFSILKYMGLIGVHGIGYYYIHKLMHVNHTLKWIHDFHHEFTITVPSTGNAVSIFEFQLAYVLPFLVGALLLNPSTHDFQWSIFTISCFNLFIHTKELEYLKYPFFLVSPKDHITHHRTRSNTYSAPIVNIDNLLNR